MEPSRARCSRGRVPRVAESSARDTDRATKILDVHRDESSQRLNEGGELRLAAHHFPASLSAFF
jgi:hypothetical protein